MENSEERENMCEGIARLSQLLEMLSEQINEEKKTENLAEQIEDLKILDSLMDDIFVEFKETQKISKAGENLMVNKIESYKIILTLKIVHIEERFTLILILFIAWVLHSVITFVTAEIALQGTKSRIFKWLEKFQKRKKGKVVFLGFFLG